MFHGSGPAAARGGAAAGFASYAGREASLLTRHGKEAIVAPILADALGLAVRHVGTFDTDRLGTFTRDIARPADQLETALRKARIGMELAGLPLGLASEGAFGADPALGLLPWNVELLVWVDDRRGLQVTGRAEGPARFGHARVHESDALGDFARRMGFPDHGLVLRPGDAADPRIRKDMRDWTALHDAFDAVRAQDPDGRVFVEVDGRAHRNATRRGVIAAAARDLALRLATSCPACAAPGFGREGVEPGLPCADCDTPTCRARAERWRCPACRHESLVPRPGTADPGHCPTCNP